MQIRYSIEPFSELEFLGTSGDFKELARVLFQGEGNIVANNGAKPTPHQKFGRRISIKTIPGKKVTIALNQQEVAITGDIQWLNVLGQNIDGLSKDAKAPYHIHIEFFQDHFYLDSQSFPLVCSLKD